MTSAVYENGRFVWRNENGEIHRPGGLPAVGNSGDGEWYENGKRHRLGGLPAVISRIQGKLWYENGKKHRLNGLPAVEAANGDKEWYVNDKLHRRGGLPAIERVYRCIKEWYVNGKPHRLGGLPATEDEGRGIKWCEYGEYHRLGGLPAFDHGDYFKEWYIRGRYYTHKQVISYYEILTRFGRYCLKKIRSRQLKLVKFILVELLGMPIKGRYLGGQDSHKVASYFMNYVKN